MADPLGGGLPFAVPEIHNIKTDEASDHAGAIAYGRNGEKYRAVMNVAGTSQAAGVHAFHDTQAAVSASADSFKGFVANSSAATANWAGVWASSVGDDRLGWLQVAGPITVTLTASAEASANFPAPVVATNSTGVQTADASDVAIHGLYGMKMADYSAAQSTIVVNLQNGIWG